MRMYIYVCVIESQWRILSHVALCFNRWSNSREFARALVQYFRGLRIFRKMDATRFW